MHDEVTLYPLTEARVSAIRGEPERVVLIMKSGKDERHYLLHVSDLAVLAKRLAADATLLAQT